MAETNLGKPGVDFVGVGVGVMVRNQKGEFLLGLRTENAKNEPNKWTFPGGELEFGEKLFDCAKRETMEETGIEVEPIRLVKVIDHIIPDENQHWVNPIVQVRVVSGEPKTVEPHKIGEWKWFSLENMPENITTNLAQLFSQIKEGKTRL